MEINLKCKTYSRIFINHDDLNSILKEFCIDGSYIKNLEELNRLYDKFVTLKEMDSCPFFVVKPSLVYKNDNCSFIIKQPYIKWNTLDNYIKNHQMSLSDIANFMRILESSIMAYDNFVFPDIASCSNIFIKKKRGDKYDFKVADLVGIQFGNYSTKDISGSLYPPAERSIYSILGLKKCYDGLYFNKQIDIRSMVSLFYHLLNGSFYSFMYEYDISSYEKILEDFGIPESSELYRKSMITLDGKIPNEPISDSIIQLVNDGYVLEGAKGRQKKLIKK